MDGISRLEYNIRDRYAFDSIIRASSVFLLLMTPLVAMIGVLLVFGIRIEDPALKKDLMLHSAGLLLSFEPLMAMCIMYYMHRRLGRHSERDHEWRSALIDIAEEIGCHVNGLRDLDKKIRKKERTHSGPIAVFMIGIYAILITAYILMTGKIGALFGNVGDTLSVFSVHAIGVFLSALVFLTMMGYIIKFPYKHEKYQLEFVKALSKELATAGVRITPMGRNVIHMNWIIHFILFIVTFGLYSIVLIWTVARNANNHVSGQWYYEEKLLNDLKRV